MVPRTILSRCAQLALSPLPRDAVLQGLARLAPELPPERAEVLAALAEGSIGRALELEATGWLTLYAEWLQRLAVARESEAGRLACALQLAQDTERLGFRGTAELLGFILRRLARLQAGQAPRPELFEGEAGALAALAAGRGLDHWVALWDKLRALGLRVEALNLDPLQALVPLVHGLCGGRVEPELGII
jgi:DNA polymerase-3 subunit delta'